MTALQAFPVRLRILSRGLFHLPGKHGGRFVGGVAGIARYVQRGASLGEAALVVAQTFTGGAQIKREVLRRLRRRAIIGAEGFGVLPRTLEIAALDAFAHASAGLCTPP